MSESRRGGIGPHLALIAVQIMFGSWPIFGKVALRVIPSSGIVAIRTGGAAVAFILLHRLLGVRQSIDREDYPRIILYAFLGVIFNQLLYTKGLSLSTVVNVTIISTAIPVFALLIGVIMGLDRASLAKAVGVALAAGGVVYLIDPFRTNFTSETTVGNLLVVGNTLSYAAYIAISKPVFKRYGPLLVITWIFIVGAIVAVPFGAVALWRAPLSEASAAVWLSIAYIILFPTVGSYYLNAWALARVEPSTVAVYIYLQPLVAFVLAPLVLREPINPRSWLAAALIFLGVFFVTRKTESRAVQHVTTP